MHQVLFVCVHNAGRSQMAEALFNRLAAGRAIAHSAGTLPAPGVHPVVRDAMAEVGIDLTSQHPKLLTLEMLQSADRVITMGCGIEEPCPAPLLERVEDWGLEDPAGQPLQRVRQIREEIHRRVQTLVKELAGATAEPNTPPKHP